MSYPTWSDLSNESVIPPLGTRKAPDLGSVAVLAACEPDFRLIRSQLPDPSAELSFFTSTLITTQGGKGTCVAGPFIGAPYAAILLESLIARGVTKIIMVGWCGAVSPDINVGDIIIPTKAIVDEGTSCNYVRLDKEIPCSEPDRSMSERLFNILDTYDVGVENAPIWTTDAIYRETPGKIAWFRDKGAKAVEMECSALFSVAQYRNVSITAALAVSDSVASEEWDPGFRKKQFKQARKATCSAALKLAKKLCKNG